MKIVGNATSVIKYLGFPVTLASTLNCPHRGFDHAAQQQEFIRLKMREIEISEMREMETREIRDMEMETSEMREIEMETSEMRVASQSDFHFWQRR